jgi:hypothetical protein
MAKHEKGFDPKDSHGIFKAGDHLGRHHISGDSRDEDVADRLIKNKLHGHARIGAGQHCCKGFLFIDGVLSQDGEVVFDRCRPVRDHPLVAREQVVERFLRAETSLRVTPFWKWKSDSGLRSNPCNHN